MWQEDDNDLSASLTWHILTNSPHRRDKSAPSGPKTRSTRIDILQGDFRLITAPSWTREPLQTAFSLFPYRQMKSKTSFPFICACNTSSLTTVNQSNVSLKSNLAKTVSCTKQKHGLMGWSGLADSLCFISNGGILWQLGLSDARRRLKCHTTISRNYKISLVAGNRPLL